MAFTLANPTEDVADPFADLAQDDHGAASAQILGGATPAAPAFQTVNGKTSEVPRAIAERLTPDLGPFSDLATTEELPPIDNYVEQFGMFSDLVSRDTMETEKVAAEAQTPETVYEPALSPNPKGEEIRAPLPTDTPDRIRLAVSKAVDKFFEPGQTSPPLISREVAAAGVHMMAGPARTGARIAEAISGKPITAAVPGVEQAVADAISGFSSPESAASLPLFAIPGVAEAYALGVATKLPEQLAHVKETIQTHGLFSSESAKAITSAGVEDLFGFLALKGAHETRAKFKERFTSTVINGGDINAVKEQVAPTEADNPFSDLSQSATFSPHDLTPAIRIGGEGGRVIKGEKGQEHKNIYEGLPNGGQEELAQDPEHGFELAGNFRSRAQAATDIGETDPLTSQRLIELQKDAELPAVPDQTPVKGQAEVPAQSAPPITPEEITATAQAIDQPQNETQVPSEVPAHLKDTADSLGLQYDGPSQEGHAFTDPETGSVLNLPADATADTLHNEILVSREKFADAQEPPAEADTTFLTREDASQKLPPQEEAARQKAMRESERDLRSLGGNEGVIELADAIGRIGGLPDEKSPHYIPELNNVFEMIRDKKRTKTAGTGASRLIKRDAKSLDDVTGRLREYGFKFDTADDMIAALENRFGNNHPVYGTIGTETVSGEEASHVFQTGRSMGAAREGELTGQRRSVRLANEDVDRRRELRGEEPVMRKASMANPDAWEKAMDRIDADPTAAPRLVDRINSGEQEATTRIEQLMILHEEIRLDNERQMEAERMIDENSSPAERRDAGERFKAIEERLAHVEAAGAVSGSELGGALQIRQFRAHDDFTPAAVEARAEVKKGAPLTPEEKAKVKEDSQALKDARVESAKAAAEVERQQAMSVLDQLLKDNAKEISETVKAKGNVIDSIHKTRDAALQRIIARRGKLHMTVDPLNLAGLVDEAIVGASHIADGLVELKAWGDRMVKDFGDRIEPYLDELFKRSQQLYHSYSELTERKPAGKRRPKGKPKAEGKAQALTQKDVFDRMREKVIDGMRDLDEITGAVRADLKGEGIDVTDSDLRRTLSEYGKTKRPSKEEDLKTMRDLRQQSRLVSALEDVLKNEAPKRTGVQRDKPSKKVRDLTKRLADEMRNRGIEPEGADRLTGVNQQRENALNNQIEDLEKEIATGARRGVRARVPDTEPVKKLRARRDELKKQRDDLRANDAKYQAELHQKNLNRYKDYLDRKLAEINDRRRSGNYAKVDKKARQLDDEALRKKADVVLAQRALTADIENFRLAQLRRTSKIAYAAHLSAEAIRTERALITAADLSAVLRQGGFLAFAHPIRAARALPDMLRALKSERVRIAMEEAIKQRANYPRYLEAKLYLSEEGGPLAKMEEVYMSRWAKHIPLVAASERAYTTFLNRIRADSFDAMLDSLTATPEAPTIAEMKAIANYVNVVTGRGHLGGKLGQMAASMNTLFFAPRFVISRFETILGQPISQGFRASPRMGRMIAAEYARMLRGAAVVFGLGILAGGTVETDPRSSDFMKLRFGNTRLDPFFGLNQATVFLARMATGRVVPQQGGVKKQNQLDTTAQFLRNKLAPIPGGSLDALQILTGNKTPTGHPTMILPDSFENIPNSVLGNLTISINLQDVYKAMQDQGVPKGTALGLLSTLGMGVQTYGSSDGGASTPAPSASHSTRQTHSRTRTRHR